MAYAYSTGLSADNRAILVSGLSGNVTVKFKLLVNMPATPSINYWYFFDGRYISGNSYLFGQNGTWSAPTNVTGLKVNGVTSTFQTGFKNAVTNDILEFTISSGSVGSGLCLFNRFNQSSEVLQNLQITDLQITDAAGVHSIVFPATGNTVADPLGALTITIPNGTDSQWVFYSDGSATTAAISATMPQMSVAASAAVSAPVFASLVDFGMPQLAIAANAAVATPTFTSTAALSMPQFTVSLASNVFAPGNSAIASFSMPQFSIDVSASASAPIFSSVIAFEMPQMSIDASANSLIAGNSAAIDCTMPQMFIDVSTSSSAPIYSAVINAAMPQFSVIAYSGGIIRIGGDGSHIEQVAISTELLYNYLNTHIDAPSRSTHIERL